MFLFPVGSFDGSFMDNFQTGSASHPVLHSLGTRNKVSKLWSWHLHLVPRVGMCGALLPWLPHMASCYCIFVVLYFRDCKNLKNGASWCVVHWWSCQLTLATMRYNQWLMHDHSEGTVTAMGGLAQSRSKWHGTHSSMRLMLCNLGTSI